MQITTISAKPGSSNNGTGLDAPYVVVSSDSNPAVYDWDGTPLSLAWILTPGTTITVKSNYREVYLSGLAYTSSNATIVNMTCVNVNHKP